jgi:ArsR family transcriptional regulator
MHRIDAHRSNPTCCAPLSGPALDEHEAQATAALFKALGDPARVRLLNLLATSDGPICACHFEAPLGLSQPTISHHLKKLVKAGLVEREQRGIWAYYSIDPAGAARLREVANLEVRHEHDGERRAARAGAGPLRRGGPACC